MEFTKKRRRRNCQKYNEEISDRHFRRHNCNAEFDGEPAESNASCLTSLPTNATPMDAQEVLSQNVNEEDAYAYFDCQSEFEAEFNENLNEGSSDSEDIFEDFDLHDEDATNFDESRNDSTRQENYIFWILKVLLKWQSVFFVSDNALIYILVLIKSILYIFSCTSDFGREFHSKFPLTLYQMNKFLKYKNDNFDKFVICTKCYCLYKYNDCFHLVEGRNITKNCIHVSFPNHRLAYMRRPCGNPLLKCIKYRNGERLVPYKSYCYKSVKDSLSCLVRRPEFEKQCEIWRERNVPDSVLMDIYDGEIWKDFNGGQSDFLVHQRNYALMLNVDWFQPYKYTNYSVGAVYLSVLNLPREERFKRKNIMLVGLIPDMNSEPPTNTFIEPLVTELKEAWHGFQLKSYSSPDEPVEFRLALLCVGCDIPASRKLSGFLGHAATMGCNKCLKSFPGMVGEKEYGGFEVSNWNLRNNLDHRTKIREIMTAKSKVETETLERRYGVRYSVLLELDYFDPVRMTVLDPMHNLFLGTAKHFLSVLKATKALTDDTFCMIQKRDEMIRCPSEIGKLPQNISSSFGGFTADQWKNWTIIFSIFCLKGAIPEGDLECWRKFVLACKSLCCRVLQKSNVKIAQLQLLQFCKLFEKLYGKQRVTPNMHMHSHLEKCIYDYGPIYAFWLFSFERENGILGSIPSNKREIEIQLMRKFMRDMSAVEIQCDIETVIDFGSNFEKCLKLDEDTDRGTLGAMKRNLDLTILQMSSRIFSFKEVDWVINQGITYGPLKKCSFKDFEMNCLEKMYQFLYPDSSFIVSPSYQFVSEVYTFGTVLGTKYSRSVRSSMILAHWCGQIGDISENFDLVPRPGQIEKILIHNLVKNGKSNVHALAKVLWSGELNDVLKYHYGKPVEVWRSDLFEQTGSAMFIPIQRIKSKFVYALDTLKGKNVIIVCPRDRYLT